MPKQRSFSPIAELDQFDLSILEILQKNNAVPQREIGEQVNLSAAAVQRRIKRMQEQGVITANVAVLDPERVGRPLTLLVEVALESERPGLVEMMRVAFADAPEVQQCYYVTGEADFILVMTAASMAEYESISRRLFFGNENVKRFKTHVVLDKVKIGLAIPISSKCLPEAF